MRDFLEGIIEFRKASRTDAFIRDEKRVCSALQHTLSDVYLNDGDEVELVERTVASLNSSRSSHFGIESMFIHGNRSQIEFDYYGKRAKKELGDLLVVSTLAKRGTPLLQKLTIIQAKRDTRKPCSWGIDREQLFFLSNWPEFKGVKGIFPKADLFVPDYSGCLGSYYLYREPGEFVFVSARALDESIGSGKRTTFDELLAKQPPSWHSSISSPFPILPLSITDLDEADYYFRRILCLVPEFRHSLAMYAPYGDDTYQILQNVYFSKNIYDAIGNFARLNIGELIFAHESAVPVNELGYRLLNTIIRYLVGKEPGRLSQLTEFNHDAPFFEEVDLDGISLGIVHTITEVAPG